MSKQVVIAGITPFQFMRFPPTFFIKFGSVYPWLSLLSGFYRLAGKTSVEKWVNTTKQGYSEKRRIAKACRKCAPYSDSPYMYTISSFWGQSNYYGSDAAVCLEVAYSP